MSEWKKAVGVVTQLVLSLKPLLITFFLDRNPRLTKEKQGSKRQIRVVYTRNDEVMKKPMAKGRHLIPMVIEKDLGLNSWLNK
jgi:hypothetical protein